ncbi:MAG: type II secretion system F family protein [Pseudohongiellaceae bacterium]
MATKTAQTIYVWRGIDKQGNKTSGELAGASPALVRAQLRKQGVRPTKVRRKPKGLFAPLFGKASSDTPGQTSGGIFTRRKQKITPLDITLFTRQLATMMKAGIPLVQSYEIVSEGLANQSMRNLIMKIRDDVASGNSFADSIRKHQRYFDELFCNLVEAGEISGTLETMLARLASGKEKSEALKAKVKKAMNYPLVVVAVSLIVTGVLLVKVVPQFATTFASFGAELPAFTRFVLGLSDMAIAHWWKALIAAVLAGFAFKQASQRSTTFANNLDRLALKLPVMGPVLHNTCCARFTRTLATVFSAGVPLVDALDSVAGATGNVVYATAIKRVKEDITNGQQLNIAIKSTELFPVMLTQMVSVGEESGTLDAMLDKCADHYEAEVDNTVDGLTALLEPMIMVILGTLVGGLMVAMYLPIFQLGQVV